MLVLTATSVAVLPGACLSALLIVPSLEALVAPKLRDGSKAKRS